MKKERKEGRKNSILLERKSRKTKTSGKKKKEIIFLEKNKENDEK